ncbi:MAG: histidine triad nucleotide-binding protein [Ignavibacteria bacterium]|nr:histidine triad nucleotide-binding protein [Ignavibacteria bacterium]
MDNCLFCKIINKQIPAAIEYETDDLLAFNDISPQAPVHILIIPKQHFNTPAELNNSYVEIAGKITAAAAEIAAKKQLNSYRLVMNCNEDAGQSVFHVHMHLLGGRKMNWPPG